MISFAAVLVHRYFAKSDKKEAISVKTVRILFFTRKISAVSMCQCTEIRKKKRVSLFFFGKK